MVDGIESRSHCAEANMSWNVPTIVAIQPSHSGGGHVSLQGRGVVIRGGGLRNRAPLLHQRFFTADQSLRCPKIHLTIPCYDLRRSFRGLSEGKNTSGEDDGTDNDTVN